MAGTLYVVSTPIGNMRDITFRAVDTMKEADLILCEDTRVTSKLTRRYGIDTPLESFFSGNEEAKTAKVCERMEEGLSVALVTDAGTPCVSDPGYLLVKICRERNMPVVPIPGPSAITTALSVSGLPGTRVLFLGFPPRRSSERKKFLKELVDDSSTLVFYEAPHRIRAFLKDTREILSGRECLITRELTKRYENIRLLENIDKVPERGEFVILFGPPSENEKRQVGPGEAKRILGCLVSAGMDEKEAIREIARQSGMTRRQIYGMVKIKEKQ